MSKPTTRPPKVLMLLTSDFVTARYEALRARAPDLEIVTELGADADPDVTALFAFKLPAGIAPRLPNLQLAASEAESFSLAGIDGWRTAEHGTRAGVRTNCARKAHDRR